MLGFGPLGLLAIGQLPAFGIVLIYGVTNVSVREIVIPQAANLSVKQVPAISGGAVSIEET